MPLDWEAVAASGQVPLLLIRHGRTAFNAQRRFVGKTDIPLDEHGLEQAARLGARWARHPRAGLYSSVLSRARQTAAALGEAQLIEGIHELDQGVFEGESGPAMMQAHPQVFEGWVRAPAEVRIPGGETLGECHARSLAALTELLRAHEPGPPVMVVSHQMVIASTILHALGLPLRFIRLVKQGNTAVNLLGWSRDEGLVVYHLNDLDHLED